MAIAAFVFSIPSTVLAWILLLVYMPDTVAAQVILALLLAINLVGLALFQIPWCCQKGPCFLYTAGGFAVILFLAMLALGLAVGPILGYSVYMIITCAFGYASAICWAIAAVLMFIYVRSVKQAESKQEPNNNKAASEVDLEKQQASAVVDAFEP